MPDLERSNGLLAWQLSLYPQGHADRQNLWIHAITAPLFCAGTLALVAAPFVEARLGFGALLMVVALVAQGRGHRIERERPKPFRGFSDFVARFFAEQWITFPRFVLSGAFRRALRARRE
jgi:uncharacterized membrane protein YGL010W